MRTPIIVFVVLASGLVAAAVPESRVVLQGTRNTRELGGISLGKNRWFRHKMVYRSGMLCSLPPEDVSTLNGLNIRSVVDLRMPQEIVAQGKDVADFRNGRNTFYLPMGNSRGLGREAYYYLIRENNESLRRVFGLLSRRDSYPVLYHCAAGKDRTGIISAILLELLGATREDVMDDYLQSVRNSPQLIVSASWLEEVFKVEDRSGGPRKFLEGLGVTPAELDSIPAILVETRG